MRISGSVVRMLAFSHFLSATCKGNRLCVAPTPILGVSLSGPIYWLLCSCLAWFSGYSRCWSHC